MVNLQYNNLDSLYKLSITNITFLYYFHLQTGYHMKSSIDVYQDYMCHMSANYFSKNDYIILLLLRQPLKDDIYSNI